MEEYSRNATILLLSDIDKFTLNYAQQKPYAWSIFGGSAASLTHGFFALITLPLNLIVTISVSASGEKAFTYNEKKMKLEELKMFARYPMGLPAGIDLTQIQGN